jgi:tetraacyldisaccharide 4'-kinase
MEFLKLLLFPISVIYGLLTGLRNKLYDWNVLLSKKFDTPVIVVGNLSVGGTGKTPHTEYLIRLLNKEFKVATLSRGYKRKTKGFILANNYSTSKEIGDEPQQYKQKFPHIDVAVDGNRCRGINKLIENNPTLDVILLDDAFQHRSVKSGLSIILTDFYNVFVENYMLPTGTLREYIPGYKRADIIVVTKTPQNLFPITKKRLIEEIKPFPHQKLFFSYIKFCSLIHLESAQYQPADEKYNSILMVTGIANSYPLEEHLKNLCLDLVTMQYPDHHQYSEKDLIKIKNTFNKIASKDKIIVTTEKDAMRFMEPCLQEYVKELPLFYVPIEVELNEECKTEFDNKILNYVRENKTSN